MGGTKCEGWWGATQLTNNQGYEKLGMINAIIVIDGLLQSIVLSVLQEDYTMDTRLIYSLAHQHPRVDSILTNGGRSVLMRPANDFISIAVVYEAVGARKDAALNSQAVKTPPLVLRLMRQLQRHFYALNAVDVTRNILVVKQRLQCALNPRTNALKRLDDKEFYFIDAVIKANDKVHATKDNLSGPLVCISDAAEIPVMLVYDQVARELGCTVEKGIEMVSITLHLVSANCSAGEYDVELRPPSLSHFYKYPVWTICSSYGGKYSLCNLPDGVFSYAEVVFEGLACKSGDIYRFYF